MILVSVEPEEAAGESLHLPQENPKSQMKESTNV
jgi:hypothetical protein